jgi:hypothetical protein
LNLILDKLYTHPIQKVTKALRSILSNSETILIIHHLRHSLAMGGYTSRFTENLPLSTEYQSQSDNNASKPPTLSLETITNLLTACVDAIGPIGWISASTSGIDAEPDNIVADMKSEISAALVGIEEASYLKGILREFVRCAGTGEEATQKPEQNTASQHRKGVKHEKLNGADILTFPTGAAMDIDEDKTHGSNNASSSATDGKSLPLSLKIAQPQNNTTAGDEGGVISRKKVQKGNGEVRNRSSREIGYLKRKAVGKYSFERIIV